MFSPTRDEVRLFFCDTWTKYRRGAALTGLEQTALSILLLHPEYQKLLEDGEDSLARDYSPASGTLNPFLHLSLHLAIEEQLSIDQPAGIRACYERLVARGSEHDAKHDVLECLGETMWEAQRTGRAPDEHAYLACLERKANLSTR